MKLCELGNNCMHSATKAGLRLRLHETNGNTSPTKIRLAIPQWKKLTELRSLWESRVRYIEVSFDFMNFAHRRTKKSLRAPLVVRTPRQSSSTRLRVFRGPPVLNPSGEASQKAFWESSWVGSLGQSLVDSTEECLAFPDPLFALFPLSPLRFLLSRD
jgi:hypothetical protein